MFGGYGNTIALKNPFIFLGYGHNAQNPLMFSGYGDTIAPKSHSGSQIFVTQLHLNQIQLHAEHIHYLHRLRWHNYTQNPFMFSGYGHITPKTPYGRIACMVYAFIGIPLLLVFMAGVGERLCMLSERCLQCHRRCSSSQVFHKINVLLLGKETSRNLKQE